jgi:catechol 2,3-dioxygenase-like lactoylglutathione lyase family enzyme
MIIGVQDVYYNVQDMARARAFYCDLLGLPLVDQNPHWASLNVGGVRVGLHWTGGPPVPPTPHDEHGAHAGATLTLKVDNLRDEVERLTRGGVHFLGSLSENPWGSLAVFLDPDGNVIKLMQPPR